MQLDQIAQTVADRLAVSKSQLDTAFEIDFLRNQLQEEFAPRAKKALSSTNISSSNRIIADIPCLVVEPSQDQGNTTVLYLYGGGYISGKPEYELPIVASLAEQTGLTFILPDYSLAPEKQYPDALHEVEQVYDVLASEKKEIILSGESAGGGLALCLLNKIAKKKKVQPSALCLFSPWVDLTEEAIQLSDAINDPSISTAFLHHAAKTYCNDQDRIEASPLHFLDMNYLPPTYISTGSNDIMLPTLQRLQQKSTKTHHPIEMTIWPEMWHVFELYDELPTAKDSIEKAATFITSKKRDAYV